MFPIAISGSMGHASDECLNMLPFAASNSRSKKVIFALSVHSAPRYGEIIVKSIAAQPSESLLQPCICSVL